MKLYAVKPEWLYGDDKGAKREVQLEILKRLGIQESEALGKAIAVCPQPQRRPDYILGRRRGLA